MTIPRGTISASMAERGRPDLWANETETAALCGMSYEIYSKKIKQMEAAGFPRKTELNGKRFIPFIEQWWRDHVSATIFEPRDVGEDERGKENFDA